MSASTRTTRVRVYSPAAEADAGGFSNVGTGTLAVAEVYGHPRPPSADERLAAGQPEATGVYVVDLPMGVAVSTNGFLKWRDALLARDVVAAVRTVEPKAPDEIRVSAVERANAGTAAVTAADTGWAGWG